MYILAYLISLDFNTSTGTYDPNILILSLNLGIFLFIVV